MKQYCKEERRRKSVRAQSPPSPLSWRNSVVRPCLCHISLSEQRTNHNTRMHITASFGGAEVAVEVDADCRTLAAFKATLQAALPSLDVETVCLEVGGRALDDERVLALEGGSVVELSPTPAARAADTLREEGCDLDGGGFRRAVESGDVRRCGLYLDAGVDWSLFENSSLRVAVSNGHDQICKLLLDRGCEREVRDSCGRTPLFDAAINAHETCKLLIDHGCNKDARDKNGRTPLHCAATLNRLETCKLLIDRGCNKDARNLNARTPLHWAASAGHDETCRLLIDRGCDKDARDKYDKTPLHLAAEGELGVSWTRDATCKVLLDLGCQKDARDQLGWTSLHFAAEAGHANTCRILLDRGFAPDAKNVAGDTPLELASASGHTEVHRLLVNHLRRLRLKQCVVA